MTIEVVEGTFCGMVVTVLLRILLIYLLWKTIRRFWRFYQISKRPNPANPQASQAGAKRQNDAYEAEFRVLDERD